jgi:hypothetical protein
MRRAGKGRWLRLPTRTNILLCLVNTLFNQPLLIQSAYLRMAACLVNMLHIKMLQLHFAILLPDYRHPV